MVFIPAAFTGPLKSSTYQAKTAVIQLDKDSLASVLSLFCHTLLFPSVQTLLLTASGFIPLAINDTLRFLFLSANVFNSHLMPYVHSIVLSGICVWHFQLTTMYTWIPKLTAASNLINQSILL